ncbi:hypothetical protein Y032_0686g1529 [Ancylostoma ceylanicum]|uniref:Uncharacterized protein n=1 Tax=Ancylostoma ceylanicum TaxID=53326 RepID=A0A016WH34_9BILA|nr:hypothetical protein Y032_0686g1529 [Ancylostoma ceylanicum]
MTYDEMLVVYEWWLNDDGLSKTQSRNSKRAEQRNARQGRARTLAMTAEKRARSQRSVALLRRAKSKRNESEAINVPSRPAAPADVSDFADCTYEPARRQPTTAANVWAADRQRMLNQP